VLNKADYLPGIFILSFGSRVLHFSTIFGPDQQNSILYIAESGRLQFSNFNSFCSRALQIQRHQDTGSHSIGKPFSADFDQSRSDLFAVLYNTVPSMVQCSV
jgi:hypothetical protein